MGWCGFWVGLVVVVGVAVAQDGAAKPNILFILSDDLGFNDLGWKGNEYVKTPNINRFARYGAEFTDAYSQAGFCAPSRSGILSGIDPSRYGHVFNPLNAFEDTTVGMPSNLTIIPQTLKKAGYRTSIIGKWHLGFAFPFFPRKRGFDNFYGFLCGHFNYFRNWHIYPPLLDRKEWIYDNYKVPNSVKYHTTQFTDEAIKEIGKAHRDGDPFFMFLSYSAPHGPILYEQKDIDPNVPEERRPTVAMIKSLDTNIGRIRRYLIELGIFENTLIIFTNDNGGVKDFADNFPLRGHKGFWWEGGIRVPFFMFWKGHIKAGQTITNPITLKDLYPTFQAAANVDPGDRNPDIEGVNLLPYVAMVGEPSPRIRTPPHTNIVLGARDHGIVRQGNWKAHIRLRAVTRLHDLESDLHEDTNLLDQNPAKAQQLASIFQSWDDRNSPVILFPKEFVFTPMDVNIFGPDSAPLPVTHAVQFGASVVHHEGKAVRYRWEIFRPKWKHMADFLLLVSPRASIQGSGREQTATVRFLDPGNWVVRVNAFDGRFIRWADFPVFVKA